MIQVKSKEIALCHISLYIHIYLPISFYLLINLSIHPSINFSYSFVPSFSSLLSHFVLSFFPYYFLFNIYCLYKNTVVSSNSYFLIVFSFILHLSLLQCLSFYPSYDPFVSRNFRWWLTLALSWSGMKRVALEMCSWPLLKSCLR